MLLAIVNRWLVALECGLVNPLQALALVLRISSYAQAIMGRMAARREKRSFFIVVMCLLIV